MKLTLNRTVLLVALGASLLIVAGIVTLLLLHHPKKLSSTSSQKPPFSVLVPKKETPASVGGKTITAPGGEKTYQFDDVISDTPVNVSEQLLPDSLKGADSTESLRKFAEGFNATTIVTAGQTVVYVGTSAAGPQWGIFTHDALLVIIKSTHTVSNTAWANYVSSLN